MSTSHHITFNTAQHHTAWSTSQHITMILGQPPNSSSSHDLVSISHHFAFSYYHFQLCGSPHPEDSPHQCHTTITTIAFGSGTSIEHVEHAWLRLHHQSTSLDGLLACWYVGLLFASQELLLD
jgi:hypothetical protein